MTDNPEQSGRASNRSDTNDDLASLLSASNSPSSRTNKLYSTRNNSVAIKKHYVDEKDSVNDEDNEDDGEGEYSWVEILAADDKSMSYNENNYNQHINQRLSLT
jgi:hypothetical protein